jgi:hypothetical protein
MTRRINIVLPEETLNIPDCVAAKGTRSRFISQAVLHYVEHRGKQNLRGRLKQEALQNTQRDLQLAAEWFPLEDETHKLAATSARRIKSRKRSRR